MIAVPVVPLVRPMRMPICSPLVSSNPLSMSNVPDVMSKVDCGVNVEFEISSTPPRSMLTAREVVIAAGNEDKSNVFVEPFGADTTRLLIAIFAKGVAESTVTVFVPALLITVKSKLVEGNTPPDQFVAALQIELTAFVH